MAIYEIIKFLRPAKIVAMQRLSKRFYNKIVPEVLGMYFGGVINIEVPTLKYLAVQMNPKGDLVDQVVFGFSDGSRNVWGSGGKTKLTKWELEKDDYLVEVNIFQGQSLHSI